MISKEFTHFTKYAEQEQKRYTNANPFPHIVIDNFFDENILNEILKEFPTNLELKGENYNNKAEKKLTLNNIEDLSITTVNFINFLNSSIFVKFLQKITNIK